MSAIAAPYGRCPECRAIGVTRERRPSGNDTCASGHVYPSADAIKVPFQESRAELQKDDSQYTDHDMPRDLRHDLSEHEVLLSFMNDCGAVAFADWWNSVGFAAFKEWVSTQELEG